MTVRTLPGFPIEVDTGERIGWGIARLGIHELPVSEAMWRLTGPDDLALDIGANVGYFAGLLSMRARETIAVEPHPEILKRLAFNATRWRDVTIVQAGASNRSGTATLTDRQDLGNHGMASLEANDHATHTFEVQTVTIDRLLDGRSVGVMKLDIEGHELAALHGCAEALSARMIRDVFFEDLERLPTPVAALLTEVGYTLYSLIERRAGVELGPLDAPAPRWSAPTYLATLAPDRAQRLIQPCGWTCLRPRRCQKVHLGR